MPDEIPHDAQVTPAHVLEALGQFKTEVNSRFDTLEGNQERIERKVSEAGLNGHTPLLKALLEDYAANVTSRQAWARVRSDVANSGAMRFLRPGKHWLGLILAGALGAIGWQVVSSAHIPGLP